MPGGPVSGGPSSGAPSSASLNWKRQTLLGVSFDAPFELWPRPNAIPVPAGASVEAYVGTDQPQAPQSGVRFLVAKMSNAERLIPNLENALRQSTLNSARQVGDPNPNIVITPVQMGQASGFSCNWSFDDRSGETYSIDAINVHPNGEVWMIVASSGYKEGHAIAKRIMASVAMQP